jgi:hypothetical protein
MLGVDLGALAHEANPVESWYPVRGGGYETGAVAPIGLAAALIPITPLWASVPSGAGSRWLNPF